jgi:hypothetical protein
MPGVREPLLNWWYRALSSPFGIELICSNTEAIRAQLYAARKQSRDPDLDKISVCKSPFDPMRLWLLRKPKE